MNPLLTSTLPPAVATTSSASGALRVISEQQLKLAPGERITMQVHREGNGIFTLSNGNQTITVEGLPNTISNGTQITVSTGNRGDNTLRWSIALEAKSIAPLLTNNSSSNTTHISIAILNESPQQAAPAKPDKRTTPSITIKNSNSSPLSSIKTGTSLTGKVLAQQAGQMTVELAISKDNITKSKPYKSNNPPFKLTTAPIPGQQTGSIIAASLQRDQEGKPLLLMASNTPIKPAPTVTPPAISERMPPGTRAIGLVQQTLTDGQLRIGVRGTEIIAPPPPSKIAPSIEVGDGLLLRMLASSPTTPPTLEIRQHLPNILPLLQQNIRQLLPDAPPISKAIAALRAAIPSTVQPSSNTTDQRQALEAWLQRAQHTNANPITGSRIAALIRDSGQLLEHKLLQLAQQPTRSTTSLNHDLKAVLTKLAATPVQQSSPPPPPSTPPPAIDNTSPQPPQPLTHKAAEAAQQGVQRIESGQVHAALSAIHHEPMRVEFPMVVFNQLVTVQMAIMEQHDQHLATQQPAKEQSFNILMALNLSHLGEVRIDSSISNRAVMARIHIASDSATEFARTHLQRLTQKMHAAGFTEVQIVIAKQPPTAQKEQEFSQLTSMVPNSTTLLDIEI